MTTDAATICTPGYTKTVRDVPLNEAKQVFAEYSIPYELHDSYEDDHLISLELGGSNDIANLWPEPRQTVNGALDKDKVENFLHAQVCRGAMTLEAAQLVIATDWLSVVTLPAITSATHEMLATATATSTSSIQSSVPHDATAQCSGGTFSFSQQHSGSCSHHGGVAHLFSN